MPENHTDVVTAAAKDGEEGISGGSFQWASGQATVVFHVANHRFYRAASSQELGNRSGDTAPGTTDEDLHVINAVAAIPSIDKSQIRPLIGQDFDLFERLRQGVSIVGIARQRPHPDDKSAPVGGQVRVHGVDAEDKVVLRKTLRRDAVPYKL